MSYTSRSKLSSFSGLSCINSSCGDSAVPAGTAGWAQQLEGTAVTSQDPCTWSLLSLRAESLDWCLHGKPNNGFEYMVYLAGCEEEGYPGV